MSKGYVYLMHAGTGHYKIGLSKNPNARLKAFTTEMPVEVKIVHVFPSDNTRVSERALHQKFATKRFRGEWFNLDDEDVKWVCSIVSHRHGYEFGTLDEVAGKDSRRLLNLLHKLAIEPSAEDHIGLVDENDVAICFSYELANEEKIGFIEASRRFDNALDGLVIQGIVTPKVKLLEWGDE